uniref:ATP synthase subunit s-like protein n=1 Tax=Caligus clemensi TaxID=344056 RepID=C1C2S1_CALCM|nr:ATP synthase subunit s-like protein [Caligus clemensi]
MLLRHSVAGIFSYQRRGLKFTWNKNEATIRKENTLRERQVLRSAPLLPGDYSLGEKSFIKDQILLQKGESSEVLPSARPNVALSLTKEEEYASYKRSFLPSRIDDELEVFADPTNGPMMERTHSQWVKKLWKFPIPSLFNYDFYVQEERKKKHTNLVKLQLPDERRLTSLGSDLSAAWFLVNRNCRVKFKDQEKWVDANSNSLPSTFKPGHYLECIEASRSQLIYEGLQNLRNLQFLKHLDVSYCEQVDEWFIDRIAGEYKETLEYLDMSGCYRLDWNGIEPLARLRNLKVLVLHDLDHIEDLKLLCLLLLEVNPSLEIRGVDYIDTELLKAEGEGALLEDLERDLLALEEGKSS